MTMIKGIPVILYEKVKTGVDEFNNAIYTETPVTVYDVLVSPSTSDDITTSTDMVGKRCIYTLAIPKTDTHIWHDRRVSFFDQDWHVLNFEIEGIEANIPLIWNKKVMVERYG